LGGDKNSYNNARKKFRVARYATYTVAAPASYLEDFIYIYVVGFA
jgi:hypothetical protein